MQGSQPSPLRNLVLGGNSTTTITFQSSRYSRDFRRNPLCGSIPCRSSGSLSSAVKILRTRSWLGQRLGLVFFSHSRTSIPGSAFVMVSRCLESSKRFCVYYLDLIRERVSSEELKLMEWRIMSLDVSTELARMLLRCCVFPGHIESLRSIIS